MQSSPRMGSVIQPVSDAVEPTAASSSVPLRRSFSWVLSGNAFYALCQWGLISVLAKLGTTATVGEFALALAITAPVFMLSNLFLRGIQATDARSEFEFSHYFTLRSATTIAGLVIIVGICLAVHHDRTTALVVMLVGCAKAIESFSDVIAGLLQKHERLDQVSVSMMLKGALSIVGFTTAFAYTRSLVVASAALCGMWLMVLISYDVPRARDLLSQREAFISTDLAKELHLAKLAAPVGIVVALGSLGVNIPRYVLERYWGSSELGIFAALAYLVVAVNLVINALAQSAIVRLSRNYADGHTRQYVKLIKQMSLIGAGLPAIGLIIAPVIGRPVLRLLYGPAYASHLNLLMLLIAVSAFSAVAAFVGCGMTSARRFWPQVPVITAALGCGLAVAFATVPKWGAMGAGFALLATSAVQIIGGLIVVADAVKDRNNSGPVILGEPRTRTA